MWTPKEYGKLARSLSFLRLVENEKTHKKNIRNNYAQFDFTFRQAYTSQISNVDDYFSRFPITRYGLPHSVSSPYDKEEVTGKAMKAWSILGSSLYDDEVTVPWGRIVYFPGASASYLFPALPFIDPTPSHKAWREMVGVGTALSHVSTFRYDLLDISRQALSDLFGAKYDELLGASRVKNDSNSSVIISSISSNMLEIIDDLDSLLNTHKHWMLGTWIASARALTEDENEKDRWEFNARNQITWWGAPLHLEGYGSSFLLFT